MTDPTLKKLKELAACEAHTTYRGGTCCYCKANMRRIEAAYTLGLSQGYEKAARICEAAENCSSAMVKLAGYDCHVQDAAAIRKAVNNGD
jgi:hypothetical protein